jgi:hypothetical protein
LTSALPQESATPTVAAPTTKSPVATPPPSGLFQIGSNCDGSFRCFSVLPSDCEAAITAVIAKARSQAPAPDTVNSNLYASSGKCAASFTCDDCDSAGCKFPLQRVFIGELENVFRSVYKGNGQGPGCKTCGNIKFQNVSSVCSGQRGRALANS